MVILSNQLTAFAGVKFETSPPPALSGLIGLIRLIGVIGLFGWVLSANAAGSSARDVVANTSDDLQALIEEARDYVDEDPERFFVAVETLLRPVVDFAGFARNVMAGYYKQATEDQRERFAEVFKWGLVRSYALALTDFSDGEAILVPAARPPRSPKRESVKMEIHTSTGEIYPLVYSMALGSDGVWRMRNIIINGVNIGLTYRNQFKSAASDNRYGGDLDRVIDAWANVVQTNVDKDAGGDGAEDDGKAEDGGKDAEDGGKDAEDGGKAEDDGKAQGEVTSADEAGS